jgi:hypothetical protein
MSSASVGAGQIIFGLVFVAGGLLAIRRTHIVTWRWRVTVILMGLGFIGFGSVDTLGIAPEYVGIHRLAQNTPPLGWALWILSYACIVGSYGAPLIMWLVARSRRRPLAQGEPPHGA